MKATRKILSIPPYLSTRWEEVQSLFVDEESLVVELRSGRLVKIPALSEEEISRIFAAHEAFLAGGEEKRGSGADALPGLASIGMHVPVGFFGIGEGGSNWMQHDPSLADSPPFPNEALDKMEAMASLLSPSILEALPETHPGCRCPHCQVMGAIRRSLGEEPVAEQEIEEEEVTEEDLRFEQWRIVEVSDAVYEVTNKLNQEEKYRVCLGKQVGCTCGQPHCEHLLAVLRN